jgi:hypothetical protein
MEKDASCDDVNLKQGVSPLQGLWVALRDTPKGAFDMRHLILITIMTFMAGLFVGVQGLAAGEQKDGMGSEAGQAIMGESQQAGAVAQLDNDQVRELQKILQDKGYQAVPVDGVIGPETQQAISSFQESQGLAVTGEPDWNTLQALAPDTKTQEFFGISPEFGEEGMQQEVPEDQMQQQPEKQWDTPSGTDSRESY